MRIKLLLVLFLSLLFFTSAIAQEEKTTVRVAISNQNFSNYNHETIKISSQDEIKIIDMAQNSPMEIIPKGKIVEISMWENLFNISLDGEIKYERLIGPLLLSSNSDLEIVELNRKGIPARYKGLLEIRKSKLESRFNVINVVDMQNYLRGVVPNEMPVSFGFEALKAQSIAARNYVTNSKINPYYDVVDSTSSQVYYGSNSYREISDNAVNQTYGVYALYDNKPISALYFSTSAGITDDWDDVFGDGTQSQKYPYLKSVSDFKNQDAIKNEKDVVEFLSKKDNGFDVNSPKFRWSVEFDRVELEEVLHTTLQQQSKVGLVEPKYDGDIKLIGLKEIKPIKRTQSGKIVELQIVAKSGEYKIKKELGIRRVLKKNNAMLPSSFFYVETSGSEKIKEENANEQTIEEENIIRLFDFSGHDKYPQTFKIIGGGFGHGVGMSQFGAYNLAKMGKKFPEILKHYYSDIKLSTIPKIVTYNEYNNSAKTEFHFDSKVFDEAWLYIINPKNVSEFPFRINEYEFFDTKTAASKSFVKINIKEYLKDGINVVNFMPLAKENKNKQIEYRVEFQ